MLLIYAKIKSTQAELTFRFYKAVDKIDQLVLTKKI